MSLWMMWKGVVPIDDLSFLLLFILDIFRFGLR